MRSFVPQTCVCLLAFLFLSLDVKAQEDFALIRKNYNVLAKDLYHDLNSTKDTLFLESPNPMKRVYTIGENSGVVDHRIYDVSYKVPLSHLEKGRYVFVVDRSNQKIIFQVEVLQSRRLAMRPVVEVNNAAVVEVEPAKLMKEQPIEDLLTQVDESSYKNYNISIKDRSNMQSRAVARHMVKQQREKELVEIEQKQRAFRYERSTVKSREDAIRLVKERRVKELAEVERKRKAFRYEGSSVKSREEAVRLAKEKRQRELVEIERKKKAYRKKND